jgi:hypothetical protein
MTREFSRQAFVRGALGAVGAGALLGSCRSPAPALQIPPTASSPPTTPVVSSPRNWTALADAIEGRVILPSSVDYAGAKKLCDLDPEDTAFPWRRQAACVQWYTETPTPVIVDSANAWLKSAHNAVQSHSEGGYINYVEPDTPAARYLSGNLTRLAAVRQKYDPGGLMCSGLS